jgi:phosphate transport system permease protein
MIKSNLIDISKRRSSRFQKMIQHGDRPWNILLITFSVIVFIIILSIGAMLWVDSAPARTAFGWKFILPSFDTSWDPVNDHFMAWPFLYGTLVTSLVAIILAIPIAGGIAIFLSELCPAWLLNPLTWLVELLAAIPSVVYGLWGIFVFLPIVVVPTGNFLWETLGSIPLLGAFFAGPIPESGSSRLAAGMILTIMIIPTITAVTRDVFKAIPLSQREASMALGSTRWETIWKVLIPYGISGFLGAIILGLGRALGETMAVTMVIGNSIEGTLSLLRPGYSMASLIANEFSEAVSPLHTNALMEIGLVLFGITLIMNMIARFFVWQVARQTPQEGRQ